MRTFFLSAALLISCALAAQDTLRETSTRYANGNPRTLLFSNGTQRFAEYNWDSLGHLQGVYRYDEKGNSDSTIIHSSGVAAMVIHNTNDRGTHLRTIDTRYPDGMPLKTQSWANGKLSGLQINRSSGGHVNHIARYSEKGELLYELNSPEQAGDGYTADFDRGTQGYPARIAFRKNGKREGVSITFYPNGRPAAVSFYHNDSLIFPELRWQQGSGDSLQLASAAGYSVITQRSEDGQTIYRYHRENNSDGPTLSMWNGKLRNVLWYQNSFAVFSYETNRLGGYIGNPPDIKIYCPFSAAYPNDNVAITFDIGGSLYSRAIVINGEYPSHTYYYFSDGRMRAESYGRFREKRFRTDGSPDLFEGLALTDDGIVRHVRRTYHNNGQPRTEYIFDGDQQIRQRMYDTLGNVLAESNNPVKERTQLRFGKTWIDWTNNIVTRQGVFRTLDSAGQVREQGGYRDDRKDGEWRTWKNGRLQKLEHYRNNTNTGEGKFFSYDETGTLLSSGAYDKNGNETGKWLIRDAASKTITEGQYKNGKKTGWWKVSVNEKPVLKIKYSEAGFEEQKILN